ncbi:MAG: hypothetical protein ABI402_08285 [Ferruginibacter sp.]
MNWKTIISFTDNNKPYRFKVATSKINSPAGKVEDSWYEITAHEIDEFDNQADRFSFRLNVDDSSFETNNHNKPLLLIAEQMMEEVRRGNEKWE